MKKSNKAIKQNAANAKISRTVRKTIKPNGNIYTVITAKYADGTITVNSKIDFKKVK